MSAANFGEMRDRVMYDEQFQAACQRYAHSNGTSGAIAAAAVRVIDAMLAERAKVSA